MRHLRSILLAALAACLTAGCPGDPVTTDCNETGCPGGQVCDDSGACRAPLTCDEVECALRQLCEEPEGEDARCLSQCEEGWAWQPGAGLCGEIGSTCLPAPEPGSILSECEAAGRVCVEETSGEAACGGCILAAEILDPDTGICRPPRRCSDLACEASEVCLQPPGQDAFCSTDCVDLDGKPGVVGPGGVCVLCPPCDGPGAAGPHLEALTGEGRCICETLPGYYWQEGEPTGVTPCDKDGDGWVRFSARAAIRHDNEVVRRRARCDLRTIDRIVLHNEAGQTREVSLPSIVDLYESDRNDDDDIIARIHELDPVRKERIPPFPGGRLPRARELNGLTKSCVSEKADYNDNGIEDVLEWHENPNLSAVQPDHNRPLVNFTYFVETHFGWYEPGEQDGPGTYHIAERQRDALAPANARLALHYSLPADGDEYWRTCARRRDSEYTARTQNRQGMDFAWTYDTADAVDWWGMGHHSQFKCMVVKTTSPAPNDPPTRVSTAQVNEADSHYRINACSTDASSAPHAAWPDKNPYSPVFQCTAVRGPADAPAGPEIGERVTWAAIGYLDYVGSHQPYIRGCVNECTENSSRCLACPQTHEDCPGAATPGLSCLGDPKRFGKLFCGCTIGYGGRDCEIACAGRDPRLQGFDETREFSNLFVEEHYELAPRTGYWMCGGITQSTYEDQSTPALVEEAPQGYRLRGSIGLIHRVTDKPLCQNAEQDGTCLPGGFTLR